MTPIRRQLLDMIEDPDRAFSLAENELTPLRLQAAQELFAERLAQIPLLARRAEEASISCIDALDDLVPLLFAHTVYKSYPASFVEQGRWDRMLTWLDTLTVADVRNVDLAGVNNVDDWLDRLVAADHHMLCSSGTTGKCSFLHHTADDQALKLRHFEYTCQWPFLGRPQNDKLYFWLGPIKGYNRGIESARMNVQKRARPDGAHWLSDEPLSIAEVSQAAAMRKRMADGSATPEEIRAFEALAQEKARKGAEDMARFVDKILDRRHEPMYLAGLWAQHMAVIRRARERHIPDGDFHPESIFGAGGGVKAVPLPPDYQEQFHRFYGMDKRPRFGVYTMTEMSQTLPLCEAGRYHAPPGLIPLFLDEPGEKLVARPTDGGVVTARFGFLDLLNEGRWGGLITGDKVQVDFAPTCGCGRPGPVILDTITRWAAPGEDDHIGCAGTIDAYIKGVVA